MVSKEWILAHTTPYIPVTEVPKPSEDWLEKYTSPASEVLSDAQYPEVLENFRGSVRDGFVRSRDGKLLIMLGLDSERERALADSQR